MYRDRWPVEGLPLWAKQRLGAARQFVFAEDSRQRLPAWSLLAGSLLAYTVATPPALPTGFWDRAPRPTSGRLHPVYFLCDEVQNMATRQLCDALDEGRGIGLHCILAH